ncbi:hypothetical protein [Microvirga lenta]|nr:hypothetical protein [Microvirga lenta]MCB5175399.1 hypothetical protein [Microvirga lenta]
MLDDARARVRRYTGLYPDENLTEDVLSVCDAVIAWDDLNPRLEEARAAIEARCLRLAQVADRFAERNLATIAKARAQAIAAIDILQDAVVDLRRSIRHPVYSPGPVLRRRSP